MNARQASDLLDTLIQKTRLYQNAIMANDRDRCIEEGNKMRNTRAAIYTALIEDRTLAAAQAAADTGAFRYLLVFKAGESKEMIEAGKALTTLQALKSVCEVVALKNDEIVGNLDDFTKAAQTRESNIALLQRVAADLEDALAVLDNIAEATKSKKLSKFVRRLRNRLNAPENSQTPT